MRRLVVAFVCVFALLAPKFCFAVNVLTDSMDITSVQTLANGGFALFFTSDINSVCTKYGPNSVWFNPGSNGVTADGIDSSLALVLTAFTTGMKVKVMYDNATLNCYGKEATIQK